MQANLRLDQKDAARVMSELRSVISVRARDMEERERKAFLKKFSHDLPDVEGGTEDRSDPPATTNGRSKEESFQPSVNGRHSPLPGGSEEGFNGARPKESLRSIRSRKDRQYFRERAESSDSDEGNVSSNHHPPKGTHLRQRRPLAKTSPSNESSCGAASLETSFSRDPESEDSNGMNGLFGFRQHHCNDVEPFGGGVCNNDFQAPLTMKSLADMAASLSRRVNLGEEDLYRNDDVDEEDDDDDVVGHDEDEEGEEESEMNDVSESQSDLDSDDIYHVTDDDEGFDGVNVGYDDDDDDDK